MLMIHDPRRHCLSDYNPQQQRDEVRQTRRSPPGAPGLAMR
jgi:hypothetical protein